MAHRPHPQGTTTNPHDGPWTSCDRCGRIYSANRMRFQYDYMGGNVPQNLGLLVCDTGCLDALNFQQKLLILPPDPPPFYNTRPEPYAVDETNWLTTQGEDIISDQSNDSIITTINPAPVTNPDSNADTSVLSASLTYHLGSVAVAYLDIFNGNPATIGVSVLAIVTGSAIRTNIASALTTSNSVATNLDVLTITSESEGTTNVNYVGIYNAASGGTLLVSGPLSATFPTVVEGAAVQFDQLGLSINLA